MASTRSSTTASHLRTRRVHIVSLDHPGRRPRRGAARVGRAAKRIDDRLQDGFWLPLGWDTACDRAEQPLFLPRSTRRDPPARTRGGRRCAHRRRRAAARHARRKPETPESARPPRMSHPGALFYLETLARRCAKARGERNSTLFGAAADAAKCDRLSDDRIIESLEVPRSRPGWTRARSRRRCAAASTRGATSRACWRPEDEFEVIGPAAALRDDKKDRREIRLRPWRVGVCNQRRARRRWSRSRCAALHARRHAGQARPVTLAEDHRRGPHPPACRRR